MSGADGCHVKGSSGSGERVSETRIRNDFHNMLKVLELFKSISRGKLLHLPADWYLLASGGWRFAFMDALRLVMLMACGPVLQALKRVPVCWVMTLFSNENVPSCFTWPIESPGMHKVRRKQRVIHHAQKSNNPAGFVTIPSSNA